MSCLLSADLDKKVLDLDDAGLKLASISDQLLSIINNLLIHASYIRLLVTSLKINASGELNNEQLEVMTDFFFFAFAYV